MPVIFDVFELSQPTNQNKQTSRAEVVRVIYILEKFQSPGLVLHFVGFCAKAWRFPRFPRETYGHNENMRTFGGRLSRGLFRGLAVDGRNPANQLRLVVYPIIYRVFHIPGVFFFAGFLNHQQYVNQLNRGGNSIYSQ